MRIHKKILILSLLSLLIALQFMIAPAKTLASSSTTYTYALDDDYEYVRTQDAYLPGQTITFLGLDAPTDIAVNYQNHLIIADSGNKRVLVYNQTTKEVILEITHDDLVDPRGVFAVMNTSSYVTLGDIYVADPTAGVVFQFDEAGVLKNKFEKPTSPMYGALTFQPEKIAVDTAGIMYVISKGSSDGIIQMSNTGEFLGFFSSNKVTLTVREQFQQFIYSDEQLTALGINFTPPVFTSVFIDSSGLVYSSSSGRLVENLKKHNSQGTNMIADVWVSSSRLGDVYVDDAGIIFTSDQNGWIDVYTNDGEFIYTFGASYDYGIAGLFKSLAAIAVDQQGNIWTADSGNSYLQSFTPTDYALMIYEAIGDYNETRYEDSIAIWKEVLKLNQLSILAHNGIGKNYLQTEEYALAAEHFRISGNRALYSEAFWELRNIWLQEYLLLMIGLTAFIAVAYIAVKATDKKYHYLTSTRNAIDKFKNIRPINDFLYMKTVATKPNDSFYYLRRKTKGSYLGAILIMIVTFLSYLLFVAGKGFIFQFVDLKDLDLGSIILGFVSIIGLFIVCSYLVTSIQDGEGTIGQIFKGIAYSFYPFIIACLATTAISYVATVNELFLLNTIFVIGAAWTLLLIFISVAEIQNYTFGETIKSILLTILFVIVILLVFSFIQMTIKQVFVFFEEIIKEVWRNVIG